MKIVCDNCTTKYQIADEKVSGKAFKIRCKKCGHVIVVNKSAGDAGATQPPQAEAGAPAEAAPPAADQAPASDAVWHLVIDREQVGPMTAEEVKAKIRGGQVDGETYGWKEGFEDWLKLSAIDNFKDEFVNKSSDDQATRRAEQATVLQAPAPQAAAPGADLFAAAPAQGQVQRAASPAAPTLMSADAGQMEAASRAAAEPPMSSGQESEALGSGKGMKGARSENSVLFSLNNLSALAGDSGGGGGGGGGRSAPAPSADKPGYANAQSEASGLIDIRAMAAATLSSNNQGGPSMGRGPDMLMGADIAPVFAPVATNMLMPSSEPQGIPKWVFALVGVGGLAIIGMIVFLVIYLQSPPAPGPVATGTTPGTTAATTGTPTGGPATATDPSPATKPATTGTPSTASTPTPPPTKAGSDSASKDSGSSSGSGKHKSERDKSERSSKSSKEAPAAKAEKEPEIPAPPKAEPPAPKKEKPAKARDDLDSLLDSASAGSGGKPKAQEKKDLPDQLTRDQISSGFKGVNLGSCKGEGASGTYMVKLTIGRNGRVSDANVSSGGDGKDCVAKAVKGAHFPEFSGDPMSLTYPFIVR
jgi:predicted Zn finger-like uncharacterized protein